MCVCLCMESIFWKPSHQNAAPNSHGLVRPPISWISERRDSQEMTWSRRIMYVYYYIRMNERASVASRWLAFDGRRQEQ